MASSFDVVVIGGGPGGYVAALRAAQLGASTAIIEKDRMGGTCLVRGCIPTKALLQSTELYSLAKGGRPFGLVTDNVGFDWPTAQKRKTQVVDQLVKGVEGLLKAGGVTSLHGAARLAGKGQVAIDGEAITAKDIVIATGSAISRIPLKGAELTIDSDRILELKEIPARLAVIGVYHREDLRQHLQHRDLGAERREHCRELHPDHTAADDRGARHQGHGAGD